MNLRVFLLPLLILTPLAFWLLVPLEDESYKIEADTALIKGKTQFLETLRQDSFPADRPNIVLITADDLGFTDISLFGSPYLETPHIDRLAAEGAALTQTYATAAICSPSRAGMITGRYQQRFGYEIQPHHRYPDNRLEYGVFRYLMPTGNWIVADRFSVPREEDVEKQGLPASEITLGELLQASGYATAVIGKWHLGHNPAFQPHHRGFDYHYGFYEAFSLFAPVDDPNIINHHHDDFTDKYIWEPGRTGTCAIRRNDTIIDEPEYLTFRIAEETNAFIRQHSDQPFFVYVPFSAPHTPFQITREYFDRFAHVKDRNKRVYYGMIAALDDAIGSIMAQLDSLGLTDNTLVMFASDNGGATYTLATDNAPLKAGKQSLFEGGIHVPGVMRWPAQIPGGVRFEHPLNLLDFYGTSAAAAGVPLPDDRQYDGKNLIPYINGKKSQAPHEALFWRADYNVAVRKGNWKLLIDRLRGVTLLYNLETDPSERKNLAGQHPELVEELKTDIENWEKGLKKPLWPRIMDYRVVEPDGTYFFAI